jgi:hypothetical protein
MKNKNLLIGGAVLIGIILYLRSRNKANESETRSVDAGGGLGGVGGGAMAQENGGGAVMQTGQPVVVAQPKKTPPPSATPTTQLTRLEVEKRVFDSCGLKPPSFKRQARNLWDDCKDRTKANLKSQGLISFNGMMEENNTSGLDFDGNIID